MCRERWVATAQNSMTAVAPETLLTCPIRGKLNAALLAKDGLTTTEEARRIEFLAFLLTREYPPDQIAVETVVIKHLGESGHNKLRADVVVYDQRVSTVLSFSKEEQLNHAILVAEIKRDSKKKKSALEYQLRPAMAQLPGLKVMGAYWDDVTRLLFIKKLTKKGDDEFIEIAEESLEHLPTYGLRYKDKAVTVDDLWPPTNLVKTLFGIANVMRSHGINDEQVRYKETVKLILARYCDERAAAASKDKRLALQVYPGTDSDFLDRASKVYSTSANRYKQAKTLFYPIPGSELPERTLRAVVRLIQGIAFTKAGKDAMQEIFLSFVPVVFKTDLGQFFTPLTLVDSMVEFVRVGPNDKVADPAMGTADFLVAAMESRQKRGDEDARQRIFGMDVDQKAYDLAIVNMILNRDGQGNLHLCDSIENHSKWFEEMSVALCNPPFGEKSIETRSGVLGHYDLGHQWEFSAHQCKWVKGDSLLPSQQLGLLFMERCYKLLNEGGRLGIIFPEGYLCTTGYGYVRQWIVDNLRIVCLIELPRGMFLKSDADLRSNILVGQKLPPRALREAIKRDYPIYTDLVRKVGYKLGAGFAPMAKRHPGTGNEIRDDDNKIVLDSDFTGIRERFRAFTDEWRWNRALHHQPIITGSFRGGRISEILVHPDLDMKPRRLMPNALDNKRRIEKGKHIRLGDVADIVEEVFDIQADGRGERWRLVEGMNIRANEGVVIPHFPARGWRIADKKGRSVYRLQKGDIIIGLVRPERRNIGMLLHSGDDIVGSPDGVAVVRVKAEYAEVHPQEWLFCSLRSEASRIQLWTESGGTSYGKLTPKHIESVLIPVPEESVIADTAAKVKEWAKSLTDGFEKWENVGSQEDRRPIINSAIIGLDEDEDEELMLEKDREHRARRVTPAEGTPAGTPTKLR